MARFGYSASRKDGNVNSHKPWWVMDNVCGGYLLQRSKAPATKACRANFAIMHPIISAFVSLCSFRFRRRASLELEVIALRHQLGVLRRKQKRVLHVSLADRILWSWLFWMSPQVLNTMVLVRPETVVGWHRKGFRLYWSWRVKEKRN